MEDMDNIVTFEDDDGNTFNLEILDYFNYNGNDYVILSDIPEEGHEHEESCECGCECGHDHGDTDVYVMQVVPVDEDNEEFVPIPEELEEEVLAFADKFLAGELDDMTDDEDDAEEADTEETATEENPDKE